MAVLQWIKPETLTREANAFRAKAIKNREPVRPRRGVEVSRTFYRQFDLPRDEFDAMDQKEFETKYLRQIIVDLPGMIDRELNRPVRYFKFDLPADTNVRQSFLLEDDRVFCGVTVCLTEAVADVVIRADVQVLDDEILTPAERRMRDLDAAMLAMNPESE
jgi:hypothetical protein